MKTTLNKKWALAIFSILALMLLATYVPLPNCSTLRDSLKEQGIKSQIIFVLTSAIAIVLFIPRTPLIFLSGICFGAWLGGALNLIASLLAATICFFIGKNMRQESFDDWIRNQSWFKKIDRLALEKSFLFVLALRMVHFVHYGACSYALGFSPIAFKDFLLGTFTGILPGTLALTYIGGSLGCSVLSGHLPPDIQVKLGVSFALLTIVGVLPLILSYWFPKTYIKKKDKLHVQAHRGVCSEVQENTLSAFERAIEVGADSIELDIHVTKDNRIVVYHDFVLEPEFCFLDGKQIEKALAIRDLTYSELLRYDCVVSRRLNGENILSPAERKIPLLAQVFDLFKTSPIPHAKRILIDIEIKSDPRRPALSPSPKVFARLLMNEIKKEWDLTRTAVRSFDPRVTLTLRRRYKQLRVIQLTNGGFVDYARVIKKIKPHVIAPNLKTIQKNHVDFIHRAGIEVMPWTANTPEEWAHLIALGVDGITTDDPRGLIEHLAKSSTSA